MMLPRMSHEGTPGYPAPEIACSVVTIVFSMPNWRSGASAIVIATVEQFGLVMMRPAHPCASP
ncbi:MAG: hypothetical protein QM736_11105 [Vicinamibacterales bacterium]